MISKLLRLFEVIRDHWLIISSFNLFLLTALCLGWTTYVFKKLGSEFLYHLNFSDIFSFTLSTLGTLNALGLLLHFFIFILGLIIFSGFIKSRLKYEHEKEQEQLNLALLGKIKLTVDYDKLDFYSKLDLLIRHWKKVRSHFINIIIPFFMIIVSISLFIYLKSEKIETLEAFPQYEITIKDKYVQKVCGHIVYYAASGLVYIDCKTSRLTTLSSRFIVSYSLIAKN